MDLKITNKILEDKAGYKMLSLKDLEKFYQEMKEKNIKFVGVIIQMEGFKTPEIIVNHISNYDKKIEYYKKAYNDDLTLKTFNGIKIINWFATEEEKNIEKAIEIIFKDI